MEHRRPTYQPDENPNIPDMENRGWDAMRQMLDAQMPQQEKRRVVPMYWRWMAAAVLLLTVSIVGYRFLTDDKISEPSNTVSVSKDVNDGKKVAVNTKSTADVRLSENANQDSNLVASVNISLAKTGLSNINLSSGENPNKGTEHTFNNNIPSVNTQKKAGFPESQILPKTYENIVASTKMTKTLVGVSDAKTDAFSVENTQQKINLDVAAINNDVAATQPKSIDKENVEAQSRFRARMTQAIWDEAKSDSVKQALIVKNKKAQSDSQLNALRREQLEQYFAQNEKKEKSASPKFNPKMDVAVLVNRNMTDKGYSGNGGSIYSLPVYPAVNASLKISEKIGFTTGLGTAAPGNFTSPSVGGSSYMSSPVSDVSSGSPGIVARPATTNGKSFLTSNSSNAREVALLGDAGNDVQQAYYWQIPLMFDYYIAQSRLKLSAGTDFSIIQKVLVGNAYASQLMGGSAYNNSGGVYQVRNFDPRLSIGAQYKLNRLLLGARFSRSFQPALQYNGVPTNGGNNQVFNISVGYSFLK